MVPAAKIQPLHLRQQVAETRLHGVQRCGRRVGVLLAEGVEVQPVQQREQGGIIFRCGVPLGAGGAKAAAGGTGVIDGVTLLCRALRVDAQPHALARSLGGGAELFQLAGRVEDDVVGAAQQLVEFVGPERGTEDMIFLVRQLFLAEAALVQAAGLGAREVRGQQRVEVEVRERLLRQQDLAAGALLHPQQDLAVAAQLAFVQQVAGGGQGSEGFLRQLRQPREGRAGVSQPHQSTRAGAWLSERGRPYLSSASR